MIGNLFREVKGVGRLLKASQEELLNITTIFLGLSVGSTMQAEHFLRPQPIFIFFLGLVAFSFATIGGVVFAKVMNLFLKEKINPCTYGGEGIAEDCTGVRCEKPPPDARHGTQCRRRHRHCDCRRDVFDHAQVKDAYQAEASVFNGLSPKPIGTHRD